MTEALNGHFTDHHAFMTRLFLDRIDADTRDIDLHSERIDELMTPFLPARALLESIPGFSKTVAEIFIAETGADMAQFPTPAQLASRPGPGSVSAPTNPPAGSNPPRPDPGTVTSKALWASLRSGRPSPGRLTSPRSSGTWPPPADR